MQPIDIFSLVVLSVVGLSVLIIFIVLARMPGVIARRRGHPQADAIAVGGWLGLLFGGILWPIMMIWAHTRTDATPRSGHD
ncbi:hypothetical protein DLJ53_19360 [Acuticoccus sediminis]|uniref:DUF3302 domain-containing protein n=1 Tax=Acuticoccus sediminis TaxID=2184697 RepID=A0A8B2NS10_9HYPH|nr:DUF3302 domain-containing protein [Acuticoccus sediminis]RAH99901.1 hypothetical protein DLJ53_19360 [Acuticoccus sediminis]